MGHLQLSSLASIPSNTNGWSSGMAVLARQTWLEATDKGNGGVICVQVSDKKDKFFEDKFLGSPHDHAEKHLIEALEKRLHGSENSAVKKIAIYTYSSPCGTCTSRLLELRDIYPNAKLKLIFSDWYVPKGDPNLAEDYIDQGVKNLRKLVESSWSVRVFSTNGTKYADQSANKKIPPEVQWSGSQSKGQKFKDAEGAIADEKAELAKHDPFRLHRGRKTAAAAASVSASPSAPVVLSAQDQVQRMMAIEQIEGTKERSPSYDGYDEITYDLMEAMDNKLLGPPVAKRRCPSNDESNDSSRSLPPGK